MASETATATATPRMPGWWRRLPVGYRTDLPVFVMTLVCWLLLPVYLAHLVTGLALIVLGVHHLRTRWPRVRRAFRARRTAGVRPLAHRIITWLTLVATLAMAVSGLLRWAGVPPQYAQHASSSYAMLTMAVVHMVVVGRPLRSRLRPRRSARPIRQDDAAVRADPPGPAGSAGPTG